MKFFKTIKIVIFFCAILNVLSLTSIYAQEVTNTVNVDTNNTSIDEEKAIRKKEIKSIIDESLVEIQKKIKNIDEKIKMLKTKEEFAKYPAIRLNIDTPLFGLSSIVDRKLIITKDVSTIDVANGYSIKSILKNNSMKLTDLSIANITVSTRDVKLDENIDIKDGNIAILKLMQYMVQINNIEKFVDNQINKTFTEYIPDERTNKIAEYKKRIAEVDKTLIETSNNLTYIYVCSSNQEQYNQEIIKYEEYKKKSIDIQNSLKNILVTDEELENIQRNILELETKNLDFSKEVKDLLNVAKENLNEQLMLAFVKADLLQRRDKIQLYINNSIVSNVVSKENNDNTSNTVSTDTNNTQNVIDENTQNQENNSNTTEEIKVYEVMASDVLASLNSSLTKIDEDIKKYIPVTSSAEVVTVDNTQTTGTINKEITKEEKLALLEKVITMYKEDIKKENKFYLDNVNYMIKDTTMKTYEVNKNTDENILKEMKYIYLNLPVNLNDYLENIGYNSTVDTTKLTEYLNKELNTIVEYNISLTKKYKAMLEKNSKP